MNMTELKEVKANLTSELAYVLKQATSEYPSGTAVSKESTQILCNTIEALFIHGLKAAFFLKKQRSSKYPEPNFWPFVCKYTHKAVLDQIAASNQIKTEVGKSRAWIRILLNENVMDNYLVVLSRDTSTLSKFYEKWAFLRDAERVNILSDYMKGLTRLTLEAPVNSYLLNTWTPTPLILSGLMSGKPARCESYFHIHNFFFVVYLYFLELVSIYSHPSMLNEGSMSLSVLDQVNSSLVSYPVQESSSLSCGANQVAIFLELDIYLSDEVLIEMLTVIPHEKGLDFQSFRCPSCRKSIGPTFASYSKCSFDEKYYCVDCFDGAGESVIPSRLIHNWDKRSRRVCKNNMIFIESIRDKAVLRIDRINPQLYEHSHALNTVKFLREKLSLSATYLLTCRKSVAEDLESRLWPKDYLYRDIHLYSFSDLLTVLSGHMESHINHLLNFTIKHIQRCLLCAQKGFICEICSSSQVIYPFQLEITTRCLECFSVYHKNCVGQNRCPKCIRRERYSQQRPIFASHCLLFDMD
ncbi:unnamed protein product [Thelazia callipaeda]|uniref:RUN domain-containing protein n=1 Tax=Thelazia callipaeda TaxID=103827 RepID=A0A0N5D2H1_THECL|nr:unnamed protein product [Thelazia callipaeda]